jgi:hypothetical protein
MHLHCLQELAKPAAPAAASTAVAEPQVVATTAASEPAVAAATVVAEAAAPSTAAAAPEPEVAASSAAPEEATEAKSDEYTEEMQARMGTTLTYRHEDGINYNYVLPDLVVGSCLQGPEDVDRLQAAGVTTVFSLQVGERGLRASAAAAYTSTAITAQHKKATGGRWVFDPSCLRALCFATRRSWVL